jgi:hypothetical protein
MTARGHRDGQSDMAIASARANVPTRERLWMWISILIVLSISLTWLPALDLPLGDDHQGRILGRLVLQADNFLEKGWSGSDYIADWEPYSSSPYAHHPPLAQFLHAGVAWAQGGARAMGARLIDTVAGILTVVLLGALVRRMTRSWFATGLALGGLAISGFYWFFGRSLGLVFIVVYLLVRLHAREKRRGIWDALVLASSAVAALHSWQGATVIGLIAVYDLLKGDRRPAVASAVGVAIGFGLDLLWIESAAGIGALRNHLEARVETADYGIVDWILRQGGFYLRFESIPVFLLSAVALVFGLRNERFRPLVGASFISVVLFAIIFYGNAWVHEYWNWRISLVLALGLGAFGSWLGERRQPAWVPTLTIALVLAAIAVPVLRLGSGQYEVQYTESSRAGALAETVPYPSHQAVAWHYGGISGPRWLSWYTDLHVAQFDPNAEIAPESLVLVKRNPGDALDGVATVDSMGQYSVIRADVLTKALSNGPP